MAAAISLACGVLGRRTRIRLNKRPYRRPHDDAIQGCPSMGRTMATIREPPASWRPRTTPWRTGRSPSRRHPALGPSPPDGSVIVPSPFFATTPYGARRRPSRRGGHLLPPCHPWFAWLLRPAGALGAAAAHRPTARAARATGGHRPISAPPGRRPCSPPGPPRRSSSD